MLDPDLYLMNTVLYGFVTMIRAHEIIPGAFIVAKKRKKK
jgi:hypothetical protein